MVGTDNIRERILDNARKQLADCDEATVEQLWGKVIAAFEQWKQEHGNRKPTEDMGMLSDLLGPKPVPFKKAAPWQCADLPTPHPLALANKLIRDKYAPFRSVIEEAGLDKVLALLILASGEASTDDLQLFHEFLIEHAIEKKHMTIEANKEWKIRSNLKKGPIVAAKNRTEKAAPKRATLDKAIDALFDKPEKPGWGMTNPQITDYLMERGGYGYTIKTVRGKVNKLAAEHREKRRKTALAQCAIK